MDYFLVSISILFFLVTLIAAAILDVRTGEISNWVWITSLIAIPIGVFRIWSSGFLLLYLLQTGLVLGFVILCFYLRILGGGDGKVIWILSLVYPWLEINLLLILLAALLVVWGTFLITGLHSLVLFLLNLLKWRLSLPIQRENARPSKQRFWFTRHFSPTPKNSEAPEWKTVHVPLIAYILIAYLALFVTMLLI